MANGIVTLAGSRLYTSMADTDEIIDEALNRFEDVFKLVKERDIPLADQVKEYNAKHKKAKEEGKAKAKEMMAAEKKAHDELIAKHKADIAAEKAAK